jgi:D-alanyl-D-alanine carboxypeptidase
MGIMRTTKRHVWQARPVTARGSDSIPPARRPLRAIATAVSLAVVISLSPEARQAPTHADQPVVAADEVATQAAQPVGPVLGVMPQLEPGLPPARASLPPTTKPTAGAALSRRFQAALDAARYRAAAFGVTFALVRDGRVVWAGSSGVDRDHGRALRPDSTMVVGSVTKTFVAAAVLQLIEEGRLGLDDSVRAHLPELRRVSREITIRQLLDHTSGLADVFNDKTRRGLERHPERSWTSTEVLETLHAPWYRPGEGWAYANTNYYLLGMVVERVTGSTLEDEIQRRFLGPLQLASTRSLRADDPTSPLEPAWATIFWASGAMSSSARDLARWGDVLYDDDVADQKVLAADAVDAMLDVNRDDYGLGVKRIEVSKKRVGYGHTGLLNAYTAVMLHLPREDVTIALLVNRTQVDLLGLLKERPAGGGPSLLRLAIDS